MAFISMKSHNYAIMLIYSDFKQNPVIVKNHSLNMSTFKIPNLYYFLCGRNQIMQSCKTAQKTVGFYNVFLRLLNGIGKPKNSGLNVLCEFNLLLIRL